MLGVYFNSWWLPALVFLILLGGYAVTAIFRWTPFEPVASGLLVAAGLALMGMLAACLWNLINKRWAKGIVNLLLLPVCGMATVYAFGVIMFASMFGPSEDGFADNLVIPANIEITEPGKEQDAQPGGDQDAFQGALLASLQVPGTGDATVSANIPSLVRLQKNNRDMLRRYLATNPAWRVFLEHGQVFATRRWMIGAEWRYDLNGYYSRHDIDAWSKAGIPDFQSRFTIGLSGKPWWPGNKDTTWMEAGDTSKAKLSTGNQTHQSHCVIKGDGLLVEVFEQSGAIDRRLTGAALKHVEAEFALLADKPVWDTIRTILPPDSIRKDLPSLDLRNSFQPGLYDSSIRVNPGEPGMIYLKAFEVTKGTRLSADRLKEASNEWIGWSADSGEVFFSNTTFTIYEGDWGKPYAARFEVWFVPDSGGAERKLMEKVFKIEGWQR